MRLSELQEAVHADIHLDGQPTWVAFQELVLHSIHLAPYLQEYTGDVPRLLDVVVLFILFEGVVGCKIVLLRWFEGFLGAECGIQPASKEFGFIIQDILIVGAYDLPDGDLVQVLLVTSYPIKFHYIVLAQFTHRPS